MNASYALFLSSCALLACGSHVDMELDNYHISLLVGLLLSQWESYSFISVLVLTVKVQ